MKTTDLRIGNIVNAYKVGVCRVDGIESDILISTANDEYISINDVDGIPLNEQWLLDLGFKVKREFYEKGKLSILLANLKDYPPNGRVYYNSWAVMESQPKYVHELQNLYFALTGKELVLKERTL